MSFESKPFTELLSTIVDNRGKTCPVGDGGIPLIATNCVDRSNLYPSYDTTRFVSEETYKNWFRGHPLPGDILFVCKGSPGRTNWVPDPVDFCIAQDMVAVRADPKKIYPKYLFAALRSSIVQDQIDSLHVGTMIPHFKKGDFDKLKIPMVSDDKQKIIGDFYFTLTERIELLRETNNTLEAIAQTLFKSWFVDFDPLRTKMVGHEPEGIDAKTAALFPDSFEESELGLVPQGWKTKKINEICDLGRGSSPRPIQKFLGGDVPWIKIADATASDGMFVFETKEKIIHEGVRNSMSVKPGDLIMSNSASCGIPVFVELEGCIHDGWLYFKNYQYVTKNYLFFWLRKIAEHLINIADGSVQKNLNIALVSAQPILCPSTDIVMAFENVTSPILLRIRENCLQMQSLSNIRDILLPRLISGQLRLEEVETIVEEIH